jgi:hypothetical protein
MQPTGDLLFEACRDSLINLYIALIVEESSLNPNCSSAKILYSFKCFFCKRACGAIRPHRRDSSNLPLRRYWPQQTWQRRINPTTSLPYKAKRFGTTEGDKESPPATVLLTARAASSLYRRDATCDILCL